MEIQGFKERINRLISDFGGGTEQGFADFLGIAKTNVHTWKHGKGLPNGASCILISQKCNISIDELLFGKKNHTAAEEQAAYRIKPVIVPPDPDDILDLLKLTETVLRSGNTIAYDALERNIRYFAHAVAVERAMLENAKKEDDLEAIKKEIDHIKQQMASAVPVEKKIKSN